MLRTRWLAAVAAFAVGTGLWLRLQWPSAKPALDCPVGDVRWSDAGTMWVARCAPDLPLEHVPTGAAMTLGVRINLNDATADDLVLVPGVGPVLAKALLAARAERRGFRSWDEVNAVTGVGPAKLRALQQWTELR